MIKNLPSMLMLIILLLLNLVYSTKVNIADCNELWGMTNSMNKKPLYSVKIFSCIVNPSFNDDQLENIAYKDTHHNITNYTDFNNTIQEVNNTIQEVNNTKTNNTSIVNRTVISEYDKIITPSPSSSYNLKGTTPSPSSSYNLKGTTPSSSISYKLKDTTPSSYKSSPSPDKESDNNNLDSFEQLDIIEVGYNSPSSSPNINKLDVDNNKSDIGLIIGIIISSCLFITITIFGVLKYKKNKLMSNVKPAKSLNSIASKTKPHTLNISQMSSKTDETASISPHPPHEEPHIEHINLPSMQINEIEKTEPINLNSRHIVDLESGNINTDES